MLAGEWITDISTLIEHCIIGPRRIRNGVLNRTHGLVAVNDGGGASG
jgi:hypothetical protein